MWHWLAKVMVKEKTGAILLLPDCEQERLSQARKHPPSGSFKVGQGFPPGTAALVPRVVVTSFDEESSPGPAPTPQVLLLGLAMLASRRLEPA